MESRGDVQGWDDQRAREWRPYSEDDTVTMSHLPVVDGRLIPYRLPPQRPPREAQAPASSGNFITRIFSELRNPLYRGGYVLAANTIVTNLIGVGYWAVAARLYGAVALGRASALISALMLVATLAQLNLSSTLMRFLPQLGSWSAGRLIKLSYLVTTLAALAGGAIFTLVVPRLSSQWHFMSASATVSALFIVGVVAWELFTLQDAALVGLQRPNIIPLENLVFGVMKLALLVAGVVVMRSTDILTSWTAPLIALVPIINWLIFYRYLKQRRSHDLVPGGVRLRQLSRFASVDYAGLLFSQVAGNLMPLLVLSALGPEASGSYYIAGIITSGAITIGLNFSTGLTVEGSASPERLAQLTRGVLRRCVLTMIPATIALILGARLIIHLYASADAARTATLLQLLAVSLFPCSFYGMAFALDRIAGKPGRATVGQFVLAVMTLGGSWLLLGRFGVNGVAIAGVAADVVVAVARIPTVVAALRPGSHTAAAAGANAGAPVSAFQSAGGRFARPARPARSARDARAERARRLGAVGSPADRTAPPEQPARLARPPARWRRGRDGPGDLMGQGDWPPRAAGAPAWSAWGPGDPAGRSGIPDGRAGRRDRPDGPAGGPGEAEDWLATESRIGGPAERPQRTGRPLHENGRRARPSELPDEGDGRPRSSRSPGGSPDNRGRPRPGGGQDTLPSPPPSRPDRNYSGRHRPGKADDT